MKNIFFIPVDVLRTFLLCMPLDNLTTRFTDFWQCLCISKIPAFYERAPVMEYAPLPIRDVA